MSHPTHLETFIRNYVPGGWRESIGIYMFVPRITEEEYEEILQYKFPDSIEKHWMIREATLLYLLELKEGGKK